MAASGGEAKISSRQARKCAALGKILVKEEAKIRFKKVERIWKKDEGDRTPSDNEILQNSKDDVSVLEKRAKLRDQKQERDLEVEDDPDVLEEKCSRLADAISAADRVVVYTGAGISTAASIPDYRGPNGVWTLLKKGKAITAQDLSDAEPTLTHMAMVELYRHGYINYVVSQNCDGLHLRSGLPRSKLSEVHGNMFIEVCPSCQPQREYVRLFDVTEKTARHRHKTKRHCKKCKAALRDTIIHFGERGPLRGAPYNWMKARSAADKADLILCLGSSLKVLRKYQELWAMSKPKPERPLVYIVNLQWTPKDDTAALKINGRCDDVMSRVVKRLGIEVPPYDSCQDPLFYLHTPLTKKEIPTTTKKILTVPANFVAPPRVAHRRKRPLARAESHVACKVSKLELDQVSGVTLGDEQGDHGLNLANAEQDDGDRVLSRTELVDESQIYSGDIPALPDHTYAHRHIEPGLIIRDEKSEHSSCLNSLEAKDVENGEETPEKAVELVVMVPVSEVAVMVPATEAATTGEEPSTAPQTADSGISLDENSGTEETNNATTIKTEELEQKPDVKTEDESEKKEEKVDESSKADTAERQTPVSLALPPPPTSRVSPSKMIRPPVRSMMPLLAMSNGARMPMHMPHMAQLAHGGSIMTANGMLMPNPAGVLPGMVHGMAGALPGMGQLSPAQQFMQPILTANGALLQPGLVQGLANAHQMAAMQVPAMVQPMMQRLPLVSSQPLPANVLGPGCHLHTLQYMPQYLSDPSLLQRQMMPMAQMQGGYAAQMQSNLAAQSMVHMVNPAYGQMLGQNAVNTILAQQQLQRAAVRAHIPKPAVFQSEPHQPTTEPKSSEQTTVTNSCSDAVTTSSGQSCDTADLSHTRVDSSISAAAEGAVKDSVPAAGGGAGAVSALERTRGADSGSCSSPDSARSSDSPSLTVPGWFGKGLRVRKKRQSKS